MLTLEGSRERKDTRRVEDELRTHSFRYRWQESSTDAPPILKDREFEARGEQEISEKMEELVTYKEQWDKFQTDACYIDEEGEVC